MPQVAVPERGKGISGSGNKLPLPARTSFCLVLVLLCVISLEVRWFLSKQLPFIMDELVDTNLAVQVHRGVRLYTQQPWERMPLMTFLLALAHDEGRGSFEAVVAARKLMWGATLLLGIGTWWIASRISGYRLALLAPGLLFGFSTFLERSIRVRADVLSTSFSLIALWVLVSRLTLPRLLAAGVGLGLAFITTQKAVYFVLAFAVALIARHLREEGLGLSSVLALTQRALVSATGFFLPVLILVSAMYRLGALEELFQQCIIYGASAGLASQAYANIWMYLVQTVWRNPAFWILGLSGALVLARVGLRRDAREGGQATDPQAGPALALAFWTLAMFLLLLQHTAKFPYLFLNIAPALAVSGHYLLRLLMTGDASWERLRRTRWRRAVGAGALLVLLAAHPILHHVRGFESDLIWRQKAIMDRVDLLSNPEDAVFDGVGMAVTRRKATPYSLTVRWFSERAAGAPFAVLPWIDARQPVVMILNYRIRSLSPRERDYLNSHFLPEWANIWVVGTAVHHQGEGPTKVDIDLLTTAEYAVEARDLSSVRLDGRPVRRRERLSAGRHEVLVEGPRQNIVVRLARAVEHPPPPRVKPFSLYPSYRD